MGVRLVYHAGALGDFLTVLPAVGLWRRRGPDAPIAFLGPSEHGILARTAGFVDEVWDLDRAESSRFFAAGGTCPPLAPPAPVIEALLFTVEASPLATNLRAVGCRRVTRQAPFPPAPRSKVDYHLNLFDDPPDVEVLLAPLRRMAKRLLPTTGFPEEDLRRTVVVHPGSGGRRKTWPLDGFRRVAEGLREKGWAVLWCLGPAEAELRLSDSGRRVDNAPLVRLAAILGGAALYLGNDAGVSHLAAGVGCPSVVLFGPSDERIWAPRGAPVRVVIPEAAGRETAGDFSSRRVEAISVEAVLGAALDLLACRSGQSCGT